MAEEEDDTGEVTTTVELTGAYDEVIDILGREEVTFETLSTVADDMEVVLEIVMRTGGATKGRIAEDLPPSVSADFEADDVIHVLRVLEFYDLVRLDGNTWRPGPQLAAD